MPLTDYLKRIYKQEIEEAKEIEKQQIIDARENGFSCEENWRTDSETYYNETFKK